MVHHPGLSFSEVCAQLHTRAPSQSIPTPTSAMAQAGWIAGMAFLVFSAIATYASTWLMGEICARRRDLKSYPEIAAAAVK